MPDFTENLNTLWNTTSQGAAGAFDQGKKLASGEFNQILGQLGSAGGTKFGNVDRNLIYPEDLAAPEHKNRPVLMLTTNDGREGLNNLYNIFLPIPMSLQFADSASYGNLELGPDGKFILDAVRNGTTSLSQTLDEFRKQVGASQGSDAAAFLAPKLPGASAVAVGHAFATQPNKNIMTNFSGVGTRGYAYAYKMIARSQSEANTIKKIHSVLRLGLYPEGTNLVLRTPPTWTIRFIDLSTGRDLDYVPKVYSCYLTSVGTNFNSTANMWRVGNSPLELDLTMAFIETKALSAQDIMSLEENGFKPENFTSSAPAFPSDRPTAEPSNTMEPALPPTTTTSATTPPGGELPEFVDVIISDDSDGMVLPSKE